MYRLVIAILFLTMLPLPACIGAYYITSSPVLLSEMPEDARSRTRILILPQTVALSHQSGGIDQAKQWIPLSEVRGYKSIMPENISPQWAQLTRDASSFVFIRSDAPGLWMYSIHDGSIWAHFNTFEIHQTLTCSISPNGAYAVISRRKSRCLNQCEMLLLNLFSGEVSNLAFSSRRFPMSTWSPGSDYVILDSGDEELILYQIATKQTRNLGPGWGPSWSPSGKWVVWSSPSSTEILSSGGMIVGELDSNYVVDQSENLPQLRPKRAILEPNSRLELTRRSEMCDLPWLNGDVFIWFERKSAGNATILFACDSRTGCSREIGRANTTTGSIDQVAEMALCKLLARR